DSKSLASTAQSRPPTPSRGLISPRFLQSWWDASVCLSGSPPRQQVGVLSLALHIDLAATAIGTETWPPLVLSRHGAPIHHPRYHAKNTMPKIPCQFCDSRRA